MQYNHISISAEDVLAYKVHDGEVTTEVDDLSSIQLVINNEGTDHVVCGQCRAPLTDIGANTWNDADGHWLCRDTEDGGPHTPQPEPLSWINSASIWPQPEEDSLTVAVSVGDPRGSFCMTVRRVNGRILLDVPHPDAPSLHMPLQALRTGTYQVGA